MRVNQEPFKFRAMADRWWSAQIPGIDHAVDVLIEKVRGRPEIVGLRIRPGPWSDYFEAGSAPPYDPDTEDLRDLPIATLWEWADEQSRIFVANQNHPVITTDVLRSIPVGRLRAGLVGSRDQVELMFTGVTTARTDASGGLTDAFLRRIAELYQLLVEDGERSPLKRIAAIEGYSHSTANKWVREARLRKLLTYPDERGKAGFGRDSSPWDKARDEVEGKSEE